MERERAGTKPVTVVAASMSVVGAVLASFCLLSCYRRPSPPPTGSLRVTTSPDVGPVAHGRHGADSAFAGGRV